MTTRSRRAPDHAHEAHAGRGHAHVYPAPQRAPTRASLLEASAAARLLGVSLALAVLWAAVYWALH